MLQARGATHVAEVDAENMRLMLNKRTRLTGNSLHSTFTHSSVHKGKGARRKCGAEW